MMPWRWDRAKESLSEELESHLKMAIAERVARGEDPAQARAAALRELGNLPLIEDVTRARWGWLWLENLLHDTRYAFRQLRRAPAFTATALLTLAFGIGANLAVFQLLYSRDPGRLARSSSGRTCRSTRCAQPLRSRLARLLSRLPASARRHSRGSAAWPAPLCTRMPS